MAFTPYHNIVGATATQNELLAIDDLPIRSLKCISIANIADSAAATVDLFIFKESTDAISPETYYLIKNVSIPAGVTLLFDNEEVLNFDNISGGYSLHLEVGSLDTVDVLLKK